MNYAFLPPTTSTTARPPSFSSLRDSSHTMSTDTLSYQPAQDTEPHLAAIYPHPWPVPLQVHEPDFLSVDTWPQIHSYSSNPSSSDTYDSPTGHRELDFERLSDHSSSLGTTVCESDRDKEFEYELVYPLSSSTSPWQQTDISHVSSDANQYKFPAFVSVYACLVPWAVVRGRGHPLCGPCLGSLVWQDRLLIPEKETQTLPSKCCPLSLRLIVSLESKHCYLAEQCSPHDYS